MKHREEIWGWMLAADFFLAGMGGAALAIAALCDLTGAMGAVPLGARLAAPACIAAGAGLLVLELGKPFQGWRVFMNPRSILTFGAWCMTVAIMVGAVNAALYLPAGLLPIALDAAALRMPLSILLLVLGVIVASYPGVLLARHVSRPFWSGPGIAALFMLSSTVTAIALHQLAGQVTLPLQSGLLDLLKVVGGGLAALQALLWLVYLGVKRTGATKHESSAAAEWVSGARALPFWLCVFFCGSVAPFALQLFSNASTSISAVLVLAGGLAMRFLVVYSGEHRTLIEGEKAYFSRLPKGDEAFLKAWMKH